MDYSKQEKFLTNSRLWSIAANFVLLGAGWLCLETSIHRWKETAIVFLLLMVALAVSLYYTPAYLHLSVDPQKRLRWAIRIRWRIVGAVLVLGLALASGNGTRLAVLLLATCLLHPILLAKRLGPLGRPLYFWLTDIAVITLALFLFSMDPCIGAALAAGAAHLFIITSDRFSLFSAIGALACSTALMLFLPRFHHGDLASYAPLIALIGLTIAATYAFRGRTRNQHHRNVASALQELIDFTGYSPEHIRRLWETSNQSLAHNFEHAGIPEHETQRLADWYRENSELYLFGLSAYNLEYKRIRSTLNVLKLARGICLDYGAGNGDLLLELAARGHPVTYYDVDGTTAKFFLHRAERRGLSVQCRHTKEQLLATRPSGGYDTIFSLDVLEHLPDLAGELTFLSSLLSPSGRIVFDVPAGATKSHPMHLNHTLDVVAYLRSRGMKDARNWRQKLPFRKEEKYIFAASGES